MRAPVFCVFPNLLGSVESLFLFGKKKTEVSLFVLRATYASASTEAQETAFVRVSG